MMILYLAAILVQSAQSPAAPNDPVVWPLIKRDLDLARKAFADGQVMFQESVNQTCNVDLLTLHQKNMITLLTDYNDLGKDYWGSEIKRQEKILDSLRNQRRDSDPHAEERAKAQTEVETIQERKSSAEKELETTKDRARKKDLTGIISSEEGNLANARERLKLLQPEDPEVLKLLDEAIGLTTTRLAVLNKGLGRHQEDVAGLRAKVTQPVAKKLVDCAAAGRDE